MNSPFALFFLLSFPLLACAMSGCDTTCKRTRADASTCRANGCRMVGCRLPTGEGRGFRCAARRAPSPAPTCTFSITEIPSATFTYIKMNCNCSGQDPTSVILQAASDIGFGCMRGCLVDKEGLNEVCATGGANVGQYLDNVFSSFSFCCFDDCSGEFDSNGLCKRQPAFFR